jgi:hypothetical protein
MVPCRSDFGPPCCLHPTVAGSALGATHFRGHIHVHCRYGPVTRDLPEGGGDRRLPIQIAELFTHGNIRYRPTQLGCLDESSTFITPSKARTERHRKFDYCCLSCKRSSGAPCYCLD